MPRMPKIMVLGFLISDRILWFRLLIGIVISWVGILLSGVVLSQSYLGLGGTLISQNPLLDYIIILFLSVPVVIWIIPGILNFTILSWYQEF